MKKLLLLAILAALAYTALAQTALSAPGCCCDPIVHNGSVVPDEADCDTSYFNFTPELPALGENCDDICEAEFAAPIIVPPPADCSSPSYKPAPANVAVKAVKGKKQLRITYTLPCADKTLWVNISRCAGEDCTDFKQVALAAPSTVYTDMSADLQWNTTYWYKLTSYSSVSGLSQDAISDGNPGDIECWNQGDNTFCIGQYYYERFDDYLKTYGYAPIDPLEFAGDFAGAVSSRFSARFNKAYKCTDQNRVYQPPPAVNCPADKQCVADEQGAQCASPADCTTGGLFGMYSTQAMCEGTLIGKKYCFFDRTRGSVDGCFACNPRMSCADYRTPGSCSRDNCNAGDCAWKPVFSEAGIGVCVDTRFPNCPWCTKPGTPGMDNNDAYNEVFDQCSARKSNALSVLGFPCIYNPNAQESNSCDAAACMDYSVAECGSPADGIALNSDNSLALTSTDPCSIKVCEIMGAGCVKNHDANAVPDCALTASDRRTCELDHYPPNTTLVPLSNVPGRMDWLDITMLDRRNGTDDGILVEGIPNNRLRVCIAGGGNACDNPSTFAESNLSMLNFNDLSLQSGKTVLATMAVGENTLKYYGLDRSNNPEIVQSMTVIACNLCQGPKVLETGVTPSKLFDGTYYTIADIPVITVSFNEPATLTAAALVAGDTVIPVIATPSGGANYDYTFVPLHPLPDGAYTFTFNAKDNNGILMDAPGGAFDIVVDTTPGDVTIIPPDGTVINDTSVDIAFIFTEPLTIVEAALEEEIWVSRYATRKLVTNLTPLLQSDDQTTYTATLSGLSGGKKNLKIHAEDFAGNPTIGKSSFWINTGLLQLRMREPTWGVSADYLFDIIIETSRTALCKYAYNIPAPVPVNSFDEFLADFTQTTDVTHTIPAFDKILPGDLTKHKLHVYCKLDENITLDTFELRVDPTPPVIKAAYAQPAVIIERRIPNKDIFTTHLKVQTDDEGFCKYSTDNVPFVLMTGLFSGFDEIPKQSHDAEINVTGDNASYTYYVACKNTAETPSPTVPITFSVDTSIPFAVISKTPAYSNVTEFSIAVETNKRAFCYIGETADTVITLMGDYGHAHTFPVEVNASGNYSWHVKCSTGAGNEVAALIIPVLVDTTPPVMQYVDDSSNLEEEPEYSYFLDQLQVKFLGLDNETAINAYYYKVTSFFANETIKNWTLTTNLNGTAFYVTGLNLTDGNKYKLEAYAVNAVGLQSEAKPSDGVTIDVARKPEDCQNDQKDLEETDLDCGGECAGCLDGATCAANTDCLSGFCNNGICAPVACDDIAKNGNETDTDCGGGVCLPCAAGKACVQHTDCVTGSCNNGVCGEPDPCSDGVLTGTETDVDCGGACAAKCGDGKNCQSTSDCSTGLLCLESTCQLERDSDNDGVKDDKDKCPNTPADEVADAEGCSPSQKFTCGDRISDGWRIRYFGSALCDGDGAASADPDEDGLTNEQEYAARTDPTNPDTDYDGWNDKVELDKGTNPLDPESHPPSKIRILLWFFLILLLLAAIGVGGYLGYQYYLERTAPEIPAMKPQAPRPPARRLRPWPAVLEQLRSIARKEEPPITDRDWITLTELAEHATAGKARVRGDVFDKLKDVLSGKAKRGEAADIMAAVRKQPEAFRMLRRISFEKLSPAEKEQMRRRLAQFKLGTLTSAELEDILAKLRVTAAYYRTHRHEIEKELAEWLSERRKQ
jgi:hypothetical protein